MRILFAATFAAFFTVLWAAAFAGATNFDNLPVGTAPSGWTATKTFGPPARSSRT